MPRQLSLTEDLVARVEREEVDPGPDKSLVELTPGEREAFARSFLKQIDGQPFRVFAYGSLIWKPAFEHVEARRVVAHGWRRSFCLDIDRWRASPEQPGLMLALEQGGSCNGVAYRMPEDDRLGRMLRLFEREVAYHEDMPSVRWLTVRDGAERFPALAFYCVPRRDPYYIHLPIEGQAARLARACGHVGSGAAYLRNTVEHLEQLGIHDAYLWKLQALVAEEIVAIHHGPPHGRAEEV
ncbi:gamma-glutamylcyclotransferase [Tabrizicola sp. J26]|uniref:gamma-glutamylcyclotransferase n=1 Tax=Alitabrizicola rongguiensis TaxID=2909234 RepID=UPI001F462146|nr:gamma-glutamylcyclotransferase [Tabrizicola rongguiensis]MCF1709185.1 gamma-glutamylcyclotransferase [Tabrizicola rongguiensis]